MNTENRRELLYQIRVGRDETPDDVVTRLTQVLWDALSSAEGVHGLDPHRWPELYADLLRVFKRRLVFYRGCGAEHACHFSRALGVSDREPPAGPTYILTLRGGLVQFVEGLTGLVWRRFRSSLPTDHPRRDGIRAGLRAAAHRALAAYLYYNESCSSCRVRGGVAERRF